MNRAQLDATLYEAMEELWPYGRTDHEHLHNRAKLARAKADKALRGGGVDAD